MWSEVCKWVWSGVCKWVWSDVCFLKLNQWLHQLFSDRDERVLLLQTHLEGIYREFVKSVWSRPGPIAVVAMVIESAIVSPGRGLYT